MSSDDQASIIQCMGCQAKLRIGANARGKTIACPKCGQKMKTKDRPASPVAASPDTASPMQVATYVNPAANAWPAASFPTSDSAYSPPSSYSPYAVSGQPKKGSNLWIWLAVAGVAMFFMMGVGVVALLLFVRTANTKQASSSPQAKNNAVNPPTNVPPATSPQRGNVAKFFPGLTSGTPFGNNTLHRVTMMRSQGKSVSLNIFIPKGDHANQTLPVMLEAPSGTNLLHGADVGSPNVASEYLPFTEETGMITVTFSISGAMPSEVWPVP